LPRGQSDFLCRENGTSATVWCDRNPVYFLSTCHDPQLVSSVSRRNKDGTVVQIPCPQLVKEYTAAMGGCDLNDQMTRLYRSRRNYRWPRRLILKILFWCMYNAYIIESKLKPNMSVGKRARSFGNFVDEVCLGLVGDIRSPVSSVKRRRRSETQPYDSERLRNVGIHHPERPKEATRNNTCVVCRERYQRYLRAHPDTAYKDNPFTQTKTVFRCSGCSAYLCIRENSNCWVDYHTKSQFWR